jgi:hypothetical protein
MPAAFHIAAAGSMFVDVGAFQFIYARLIASLQAAGVLAI